MKKFYSLVLMAAALLIGTNVWASDLTVTYNTGAKALNPGTAEFDDLQAAINSIPAGDSATIVLNQPIMLDNGILIPHLTKNDTANGVRILNRAAQRICIDLNGKNIKTKTTCDHCCIALMKGVLRLTGTGNVERANVAKGGNNYKRGAILVSGIDGDKNNLANDRSKQTWSRLYVDKDVTVKSTAEDTYAIGIQDLGNVAPAWNGFTKDMAGYSTYYASNGPMWTPTGHTAQWSAFGVELFIDGTLYGHTRGINVLGNFNQAPKFVENTEKRVNETYPYYAHRYPYIWIGPNADVSCISNGISENGNGGIYVGGWAIVDIHGEVYGQTGVFMKSGDVKLIDGNVYSTADGAAGNSGNYHGDVSGSGIFIASAGGAYVGYSGVEITGDSHVAGAGGSAIVDVLADGVGNSTVSHVDISGGTIEGGDQGAITVTQETAKTTTVYGGQIEGATSVGGEQVAVDSLTSKDTHVTTITNEEGKTVIVISAGTGQLKDEASIVAAFDAHKDSINWTGTAETLTKNVTLAELKIGGATDQVLTIPDGKILTVGQVILGENAQIIVEAGAKFIVTGKQGIVAYQPSNIVLKNEEGKRSIFLFNPSVTSNRHPMATVELITNSWYKDANELQWECFGLPTNTKVNSITCEKTNNGTTTVYASVAVFNNGSWENLGFIGGTYTIDVAKLNKPFAAYDLLANRLQTAEAPKITITGELVGNVNADLDAYLRWTPFANSYTGELDVKAFLTALGTTAQNVAHAIWVADQQPNGHLAWNTTDLQAITDGDDDAILKIQPMQAFMLNNPGTSTEVNALDYKSMVYNPMVSPAGAPRRFATTSNNTAKMRIVVTNEEGTYDKVLLRENVDTKALEKYMNADMNIYVLAEEKSAIINSEDLANTYVGFSTVKGGNFTLSFANVNGREFDLIDLETGARVAVAEGFEYEFTADANSANDYRFKIVERNDAPTAIDNTEAVKSAKGIYTITGQYMGEMNVWNTLPAGVYVVNGEKRVK